MQIVDGPNRLLLSPLPIVVYSLDVSTQLPTNVCLKLLCVVPMILKCFIFVIYH